MSMHSLGAVISSMWFVPDGVLQDSWKDFLNNMYRRIPMICFYCMMFSMATFSKTRCCDMCLIPFYDFQTSLIANILVKVFRSRSKSNTCNRMNIQEEKFTQDVVVRLQPTDFYHLKYCYISLQLLPWLQNRHSQGLLIWCRPSVWTEAENPIKYQPLSVARLELCLEKQLMIVIKIIRLHILFTVSKYISRTFNLTWQHLYYDIVIRFL